MVLNYYFFRNRFSIFIVVSFKEDKTFFILEQLQYMAQFKKKKNLTLWRFPISEETCRISIFPQLKVILNFF